jgi:hypothetical protein
MAQAKQGSKRKRRNTALPLMGAAGVSLAMTGGASATSPAANAPHHDTGPQVTLGEEEVADISLATFYVFDKENDPKLSQSLILAHLRPLHRHPSGCSRGCRCGGGAGLGGVSVWVGACLSCGGGCVGSCWQWSPHKRHWVNVC